MLSDEVTNLGVSGLTLGILFFIVRWFIQSITRKDEYIAKIVSDFNITITNHIKHETAVTNKNTKALDNLIKVITTMNKK